MIIMILMMMMLMIMMIMMMKIMFHTLKSKGRLKEPGLIGQKQNLEKVGQQVGCCSRSRQLVRKTATQNELIAHRYTGSSSCCPIHILEKICSIPVLVFAQ